MNHEGYTYPRVVETTPKREPTDHDDFIEGPADTTLVPGTRKLLLAIMILGWSERDEALEEIKIIDERKAA